MKYKNENKWKKLKIIEKRLDFYKKIPYLIYALIWQISVGHTMGATRMPISYFLLN